MNGTILSNLAAALYYLFFQLAGILLVFMLFKTEKPLIKLFLGSVTGSLLLTWLPVLFAFFFDFTLLAHILALACLLPVPVLAVFRRKSLSSSLGQLGASVRQHWLFFLLLALFLALWGYLLHTHVLLPGEDGSILTGQCTYGDMNMHLGFITSLAVQKTFPPDYSIMPGVRLSYPFLSDSISSSLYLFGCSLRFAYILPMYFAMAQIFCCTALFAHSLFGSRKKTFLTLALFFCNGGLGFAYFFNWASSRKYSLSDIFTGFYLTPTNLVQENIRWVNLVADMFLPQRATLFGYAVLFPALWLLYQAAFCSRREYFPLAGLFAAALPMIHTHSFLSVGIVSAVWLLLWLLEQRSQKSRHPKARLCCSGGLFLAAFVMLMCLIQLGVKREILTSEHLMLLGVLPFLAALLLGLVLLISYLKPAGKACPGTAEKPLHTLLCTWGVYLLPVLLLALPQLLFWTFGQVAQGGFVRGHFNWGNQGDFYLWFYLKNIGLPLFLIVGAVCAAGRRRQASLFLPALFLWWLGELIVFTPNTYDNNKLLYVAYLLLCLGAADYGCDLYGRLRELGGARLLASLFLFFTVLSGALTLGREWVSQYQLYDKDQVALAEYVSENTPADAVLLTYHHHNNAIASLTGRNIVCGSDAFLYYHGLDTSERKSDMKLMFEAPAEHLDLYEKYGVSYVVISPYERANYGINEFTFEALFTEIYSKNGVTLYQVTP